MKKFLFILLFLTLSVAARGAISQDQALSKFVQANFAYKDNQYEKAAALYEEVIQSGMESGALYYNLANSYVKLGQLGKAVLNYERALRLLPRDHDLKANTNYIKSLLKSSTQPKDLPLWHILMKKHVAFYTIDEMCVILLILICLAAALNLTAYWYHWKGRRVKMTFVIISAFIAVFAYGLAEKVEYNKNSAVSLVETEAMFEPKEDATSYFSLLEGEQVKILKHSGLWLKIERNDGKTGWVPSESIGTI